MTLAEQSDKQAAGLFALIMVTMIVGATAVVLIIQAREKYGMLPRGLRWIETGIPALQRGVTGLARRVFYGDVLKAREADRLKLERETGMTPWWDDTAKQWRTGDVTEVKNQHGFVTARRPRDYVNRVATPVRIKKGESA